MTGGLHLFEFFLSACIASLILGIYPNSCSLPASESLGKWFLGSLSIYLTGLRAPLAYSYSGGVVPIPEHRIVEN